MSASSKQSGLSRSQFLFFLGVLAAVLLSVTLIIVVSLTAGTTYYVSTTGNDANGCTNNTVDACATVQRAHDVASNDDIVEIAAGIYSVTSEILITKDIDIRGATSNYNDTQLDRNLGGRVMSINTTGTQTLSNFVIREGNLEFAPASESGAGLRVVASDNVILDNMRFHANRITSGGTGGGGVWVDTNATLTVQNGSLFSSNIPFSPSAGDRGTAIGGDVDSVITIDDTTFSSNQSVQTGVIHTDGGELTITSSTIEDSLQVAGTTTSGTIYVTSDATFSISDSTLSGNDMYGSGGILFDVFTGTATVDSTTFSSNEGSQGAALDIRGGVTGSVDVFDSTFSGNTSTGFGGAIRSLRTTGTSTITGSLFTGNTAATGGGGVYGRNLEIRNSTITGNTGGAANNGGGVSVFTNIAIYYSTAYNNTNGNIAGSPTITNSIVASPATDSNCANVITSGGYNVFFPIGECTTIGSDQEADPLLNALGDNGGPTETHSLGAGSPAIDGADPACVTGGVPSENACPTTDQRGLSRPTNTSWDAGAFEDGAFLTEGQANTTADVDSSPVVQSLVINDTTISDGELFDYDTSDVGITLDAATVGTGNTTKFLNGLIYDPNGETDFLGNAGASVDVTTYLNDTILDPGCTASGTNCYQITTMALDEVDPANGECAFSSTAGNGLTPNNASDNYIAFSCRVDFEHYTMSTEDLSGQQPGDNWATYVVATDENSEPDVLSGDTYEVNATLAATVSSGVSNTIDYSHSETFAPGDISTTGPSDETESFIDNDGNVYVTVTISCTDMTGPTTIPAAQQQYGTTDFTYDAGPGTLQNSCPTTGVTSDVLSSALDADNDLGTEAKDSAADIFTDIGVMTLDVDADLDDSFTVFWRIEVPGTANTGTYTGVNTLLVTQEVS